MQYLLSEIRTQRSRRVEIGLSTEDRREFVLDELEAEEADPHVRQKLHQNINITLWREVVAQHAAI